MESARSVTPDSELRASVSILDCTSTVVGAEGEDFNALVISFYTRAYPPADVFTNDAADLSVEEVSETVMELANEVSALREETHVLGLHAQALQQRRPGGGGGVTNSVAIASGSSLDGTEGKSVSLTNTSTSAAATRGAGAAMHTTSVVPLEANALLSDDNQGASGGASRSSDGPGTTGRNAAAAGPAPRGRRGRGYRRRTVLEADVFMRVDDKALLLRQEMKRLRSQEEKAAKEAEGVHEILLATVEEAMRRQNELRLESLQFEREVLGSGDPAAGSGWVSGDGGTGTRSKPLSDASEVVVSAAAVTTADELLRYLDRRYATQVSYLDKLQVQCQAVGQDIARAQQLVRQRRIAGEAFQAVDLEQLRIEHKQFSERMEAKNSELAELKGTSTRTVQQLNQLMGQLNELASEQTRLKREAKSRSEYLQRCGKEIATATTEAAQAESKHMALKAQQEAVKVPKIEEYMAQKAEEVELEKSIKNWERKVQIAEGQATVVRQQYRQLQSQRAAVLKYATTKRQSRFSTVAAGVMPKAATLPTLHGPARNSLLGLSTPSQRLGNSGTSSAHIAAPSPDSLPPAARASP